MSCVRFVFAPTAPHDSPLGRRFRVRPGLRRSSRDVGAFLLQIKLLQVFHFAQYEVCPCYRIAHPYPFAHNNLFPLVYQKCVCAALKNFLFMKFTGI